METASGGSYFSGIPRETWVILFLRTMNTLAFSATFPFLGVYLLDVRGVSYGEIGLVYLLSGVLGLASQLMGGRLTDSVGPKAVIITSYLSSTVFSAVLGYMVYVGAPVPYFVAAYPVFSLFRGTSQPATSSIIAGEGRVMRGFSLLAVGGNLGFAAGPALGGILASAYGYTTIFVGSAVISGAMVLVAGALVRGGVRYDRAADGGSRPRRLRWVEDRNLILFLVLTFCMFVAMGYEVVPISLYAAGFLHLSNDLIGYVFATNGILIVLLQIPLTNLVERSGRLLLPLVVSSVFAASGFLLASVSSGFAGLELVMVVITIGEILLTVPAQTVVALFSGAWNRGTYQGYYTGVVSSGRSTGAFVGSLTFSVFALTIASAWYLIAAFTLLVGLGLFLLSPRIQGEMQRARGTEARAAGHDK